MPGKQPGSAASKHPVGWLSHHRCQMDQLAPAALLPHCTLLVALLVSPAARLVLQTKARHICRSRYTGSDGDGEQQRWWSRPSSDKPLTACSMRENDDTPLHAQTLRLIYMLHAAHMVPCLLVVLLILLIHLRSAPHTAIWRVCHAATAATAPPLLFLVLLLLLPLAV